jgi:hypothetical protein
MSTHPVPKQILPNGRVRVTLQPWPAPRPHQPPSGPDQLVNPARTGPRSAGHGKLPRIVRAGSRVLCVAAIVAGLQVLGVTIASLVFGLGLIICCNPDARAWAARRLVLRRSPGGRHRRPTHQNVTDGCDGLLVHLVNAPRSRHSRVLV